jgi:hypothetical protein
MVIAERIARMTLPNKRFSPQPRKLASFKKHRNLGRNELSSSAAAADRAE